MITKKQVIPMEMVSSSSHLTQLSSLLTGERARTGELSALNDASCTPADIDSPTDWKLLNEARQSTESIIDDLWLQSQDLVAIASIATLKKLVPAS